MGVVDQTRPANELIDHGAPVALVPAPIASGRVLQLVAGIALVIGWHERIAALLLALFLIPAAVTAHDFWAYHGPELQGQLVNFLKNLAMFGGCCVAFRPSADAPQRRANASDPLQRQPADVRTRPAIGLRTRLALIAVAIAAVAGTFACFGGVSRAPGMGLNLYYRLNVFPIYAPPLRERPEDIEPLVRHFAQHFAARMQRRIEVIPTETLNALRRYAWPGNVRELENLIERAVILSAGPRLTVPLEHLARGSTTSMAQNESGSTLEAIKQAHVVRVLEETNWIVGGPRGAAARLGMKRTTLQSMMKRFAIARHV